MGDRGTLLCAPNISEGRDPVAIEALTEVLRAAAVRVLDVRSDPDHHRTVFTYASDPASVLAATCLLAAAALDRIDLRNHSGGHPRIGAVDVVPFVRVHGVSEDAAQDVARAFGAWAGERGLPVYYYEASATRREHVDLPSIRRGEFEGLAEKMADPAWRPDEGPASPHPRWGAVVTGVRAPLVRFNVNLASDDVDAARQIAGRIRTSGGGHAALRAIGVALESRGVAQVSMNLIRHEETSIASAYRAVEHEAGSLGIEIADTELPGDLPAAALVNAVRELLHVRELAPGQLMELAALPDDPES